MNDVWSPTIVALISYAALAAAGAFATDLGPWYRALKQPWFKPPDWAFGPAWTMIFACTGTAAVFAWREAPTPALRYCVVATFALNALLNAVWSVIYFRMKRPDWAFVEVVVLWLSIVLMIWAVKDFSVTATWLLVPYLVWVTFAASLNWATIQLNKPFNQSKALL
jgi:translocator protein